MAKDITGINIGVGDGLLAINSHEHENTFLAAVVAVEVFDNSANVRSLDNIEHEWVVLRTDLRSFVVCEYDLNLSQHETLMNFRSKL